ncbi:hypothetical protein JCM10207_006660 [Rhodosporidiobolus poonsookiae]
MASPFKLTDAQLEVLKSLGDSIFQAGDEELLAEIRASLPKDAPDVQLDNLEHYVKSSFSDLPGAVDQLSELFAALLSPTNLSSISTVLTLLSTRAGTFLLAGHLSPFPSLSVGEREAVLQKWRVSRIPLLRQAFRAFLSLTLYVAFNEHDDVIAATGYPALGDETRRADPLKGPVHYPYAFERIVTPEQVFETDVLVVGSGAGGGVVASELAKKGWKVLVVEKGEYVRPEDMAGTQREGLKRMYEQGGLMAVEDGSMNLLAGSGLGGGTTVNWSASLRPQHFLRKQWAKEHGLPFFLSKEFADSIDSVCNRMGVSDEHFVHSKANQILLNGCQKLGYPVSKIPQNTAGHQHSCGMCGWGCTLGEKAGGTVTWLRDAAEHGAQLMVETEVERLLFASSADAPAPTHKTLDKYIYPSSRKHCVGAHVKNKEGQVAIVRARQAVVLSAGSFHSPAVLKRSGVRNPQIGRNLHLHPVAFCLGYYDETIKAWDGSVMTVLSPVHENLDGHHHGVKLEVMHSFVAGQAAGFSPWTSSREQKLRLAQYSSCAVLIAIARDRDHGHVALDANGVPRVNYTISPFDAASLTRGTVALAEIHLVSGAKRIVTTQVDVEDYVPQPGHEYLNDPRWKEWVAKVERAGTQPGKCAIGSAHQMGSCKMGTKPSNSVVDPRGRVWGAESLYVADASVFPSASGVNPMITNMALSHSIARFVDEDVRSSTVKPAAAHL